MCVCVCVCACMHASVCVCVCVAYFGKLSTSATICKFCRLDPSLRSMKTKSFCFLTAFTHPCKTTSQKIMTNLLPPPHQSWWTNQDSDVFTRSRQTTLLSLLDSDAGREPPAEIYSSSSQRKTTHRVHGSTVSTSDVKKYTCVGDFPATPIIMT